jgi:hypothetical protein
LKHKRFFSILAIAVVLTMLVIAIPVTPAVAAPIIELDIDRGEVGDEVVIDGDGFAPSTDFTPRYVDIYFSSDFLHVGDDIDYHDHFYELVKEYIYIDEFGDFVSPKAVHIPNILSDSAYTAEVKGGTYYFYITYSEQEEIEAYATFEVIGISDFSPTEGPVGTMVELSGVGFDANANIEARFDGNLVDIAAGDDRFKGNGSFTSRIEIPESPAGVHTITIEDAGGHRSEVRFTVEPQITIEPTQASSNEEIEVRGNGFGANEDIFIYFDGTPMYITGDYDTDHCGSFVSKFLVPEETDPGSYEVEVEDNHFNFAIATLEVGAGLTIDPVTTTTDPGYVGDTVTVSGIGFKANWEIIITYASDSVTFSTVSLGDGSFSYDLTIPASAAGAHIITATDGVSSKTVTFFMEATPPEAPLLAEPADGEKASANAKFDWGEVSDDSLPISYELQVANSNQFTTESILVYKTGLTTSEYTLTDEEKLESTDEGTPYYWRVRAKDAASNASEWTSSSSFTVGLSIQIKGWLLYLLLAIGAVAIFFLGVWIGRRSVPSEDYW